MKQWKVVLIGLGGLMMAACGSSTSTTAAATPTPIAGNHIAIALADYMITPMETSIPSGMTVFDVTNQGQVPHNFTLRTDDDTTIAATRNLNHGQSAELAVRLTAPSYRFLCTQPGHASLGMTGSITVTGGQS